MPHKIGAQFWFKSDLFAIEPGEDEETNPLCYMRRGTTRARQSA
jgi:hypothetical protein